MRYEVDIAEYATPNTYREAVRSVETMQWENAINKEFKAHEENGT